MLINSSTKARQIEIEPSRSELIEKISEDRLREIVQILSIPRSWDLEPENNRKIGIWLGKEMRAMGLEAHEQGVYRNVVGMSRTATSRPCILLGAHYDSVPNCPGADDNASAVAAMLACAELLIAHDPELPLVAVAFNREEDGLLGSAEFVADMVARRSLDLRMAHVLEMVGYCDARPGAQKVPEELPIRLPDRGDFVSLLANGHSRHAVGPILRLARAYLPELPVLSLKIYLKLEERIPVLLRSDHASFWRHGLPALMWTDTSEFRNPHYHRRTDLPETLDYAYLRRVTQLLTLACLD